VSKGVCRTKTCVQALKGEAVDLYPGPGEFCPECGERLEPLEQKPTAAAAGASNGPKPRAMATAKAPAGALAGVAASSAKTSSLEAGVVEKPPPAGPQAQSDSSAVPAAKPAPAKPRGTSFSVPIAAIVLGAALVCVVGALFFLHSGSPNAGHAQAARTAAEPGGAAAPLFSLCGSSEMGAQLAPDLVRGFLSAQQGRGLSASATDGVQEVSATLNGRTLSVRIAAQGSASAFSGLRSGQCQVGMALRKIRGDEAAGLRPLGNMFAPDSQHVVGFNAIAVIVNPANAAWALSLAELRDVFSGKIATWQAVAGGSTAPIDVLAADEGSETLDAFTTLVLHGTTLTSSARRYSDRAALAAAVLSDPNAIGFVDLRYVNGTKVLRLSAGGESVAPNPQTIASGAYPLTRRLYLYTAAAPNSAPVTQFVAFVRTGAGQKIVASDGFVPVALAR
jgi:ABC-type phosphate transport system substrate-binding protein